MSKDPSLHFSSPSAARLRTLLPMLALLCLGLFAACEAAEDPKVNPPPAPECGPESESKEPCNKDEQEPKGIELAGTYGSEWGSIHEIDDTSWDDAAVIRFDNDRRLAVVQYPEHDPWNPNKFGLNAWTPGEDGTFWYCSASFDADSADAAEAGELPDPSKPSESGCGGFSWTLLTPRAPIEVKGSWESEWADETISSRRWEWVAISDYDNSSREVVVQNAEDAEYSPGLYSRVVWTPIVDDAFFYCYVAFDQESAEEAWEAEGVYDDADPENGGCGEDGFPWTRLLRKAAD